MVIEGDRDPKDRMPISIFLKVSPRKSTGKGTEEGSQQAEK